MHDVEDNPKSVKDICILVFRSPEIRVPACVGFTPYETPPCSFKLSNQLEQNSVTKTLRQTRFELD
jgi:hypothetical protein